MWLSLAHWSRRSGFFFCQSLWFFSLSFWLFQGDVGFKFSLVDFGVVDTATYYILESYRYVKGCVKERQKKKRSKVSRIFGISAHRSRACQARRALRALKALVKLQALVRGHIVRKQTTDMLRRIQTLVRVQVRARASRSYTPVSSHSASKSSLSHHPRCGSNSNFRGNINMEGAKFGSNWLDRWMEEGVRDDRGDAPPRHRHDDERSSKILEVDTWKPHLKSQRKQETYQSLYQAMESNYINQNVMVLDSPSKYSSRAPYPVPSLSSEEILSSRSMHFPGGKCEMLKSADNSSQVNALSSRPRSSSARRGPFTPTRSECSWGFFSGYSGHPNYMANTESSRAKVRSQSAPRQRLEFDKYGSMKRSLQASWDAGTASERNYPQYADLRSKAYPVSNRLDRLGSTNLR